MPVQLKQIPEHSKGVQKLPRALFNFLLVSLKVPQRVGRIQEPHSCYPADLGSVPSVWGPGWNSHARGHAWGADQTPFGSRHWYWAWEEEEMSFARLKLGWSVFWVPKLAQIKRFLLLIKFPWWELNSFFSLNGLSEEKMLLYLKCYDG